MKKFIIFILIFIPILLLADQKATTDDGKRVILKDDGTWKLLETITTKNNNDFRKVKWGMPQEQVKKIESAKFLQDTTGIIIYEYVLSGLDVWIAYIFTSNKLTRSKYIIKEKHTNQTDFINDFNALKKVLINKYGQPKEDETIWKDDLYKNKHQDWGMAIATGDLVFYSKWSNSETDIALVLTGDNFKIRLEIEYSSKKLAILEQESKYLKSLDDF